MMRIRYIILGKKTKHILHIETREITSLELGYLEYQEMVRHTKEMSRRYSNASWKIEISVI